MRSYVSNQRKEQIINQVRAIVEYEGYRDSIDTSLSDPEMTAKIQVALGVYIQLLNDQLDELFKDCCEIDTP